MRERERERGNRVHAHIISSQWLCAMYLCFPLSYPWKLGEMFLATINCVFEWTNAEGIFKSGREGGHQMMRC